MTVLPAPPLSCISGLTGASLASPTLGIAEIKALLDDSKQQRG